MTEQFLAPVFRGKRNSDIQLSLRNQVLQFCWAGIQYYDYDIKHLASFLNNIILLLTGHQGQGHSLLLIFPFHWKGDLINPISEVVSGWQYGENLKTNK